MARQPRLPPEMRGYAMAWFRNLSLCRSSVSCREHCAREFLALQHETWSTCTSYPFYSMCCRVLPRNPGWCVCYPFFLCQLSGHCEQGVLASMQGNRAWKGHKGHCWLHFLEYGFRRWRWLHIAAFAALSASQIFHTTPEISKPVFFVVFTLNQYIDQHMDSSIRTSEVCRVMLPLTPLHFLPLMQYITGAVCQEISTERPGFCSRFSPFFDFFQN